MLFMKVLADSGGGGGRSITRTRDQVNRIRANAGERNIPAGNYRAPNGTRSTVGSMRINNRGNIAGTNPETQRNLRNARNTNRRNRATSGTRN